MSTLLVNCDLGLRGRLLRQHEPRLLGRAPGDQSSARPWSWPRPSPADACRRAAPGLIVNILDQRVFAPQPSLLQLSRSPRAPCKRRSQMLAQGAGAPRIRVNGMGPGPPCSRSVHQQDDRFRRRGGHDPASSGPSIPTEIEHALRYLIDATSVTGQMIAVDAGQHLA